MKSPFLIYCTLLLLAFQINYGTSFQHHSLCRLHFSNRHREKDFQKSVAYATKPVSHNAKTRKCNPGLQGKTAHSPTQHQQQSSRRLPAPGTCWMWFVLASGLTDTFAFHPTAAIAKEPETALVLFRAEHAPAVEASRSLFSTITTAMQPDLLANLALFSFVGGTVIFLVIVEGRNEEARQRMRENAFRREEEDRLRQQDPAVIAERERLADLYQRANALGARIRKDKAAKQKKQQATRKTKTRPTKTITKKRSDMSSTSQDKRDSAWEDEYWMWESNTSSGGGNSSSTNSVGSHDGGGSSSSGMCFDDDDLDDE